MLSNDEIAFIGQHSQANTAQLLLKYGKEKEALIAQIETRQKARLKLPAWYVEPRLIFPPAVSVEQSSSEITARYKASLVAGKQLIDATGGMGVDTYHFAQRCDSVLYIEQKDTLVRCARHNFEVLGAPNIRCVQANSMEFLQGLPEKVDWLYLDPARRTADNRRVAGLADCEPDVIHYLPLLLQKARRIMLKVSPLLDIKQLLHDLPVITAVHVVAVENECREVLAVIDNTRPSTDTLPPTGCLIKTVNFRNNGTLQTFDFHREDESRSPVSLSPPLQYVYEPNGAVLKAGAFKSIAAAFQLYKIAPHSHLYTSAVLAPDFPGRIFEFIAAVKADNKALNPYLPDGKANLTVRNFPAAADELRKKLKLKDGGDVYLLATTLANGDKRLLVCKKV